MSEFLKKAFEKGVRILLPSDYQVAKDNLQGPLASVLADESPFDALAISIGSCTIECFAKEIKEAKTIFFNGLPGFLDWPETFPGELQAYSRQWVTVRDLA